MNKKQNRAAQILSALILGFLALVMVVTAVVPF